jgi:predicted Zn finger-like uncharacterized protein
MRLTCPACGARYETPEGAVPPEGRMVRCSNCRAEWRARPGPELGAPAAPEAAPAAEPFAARVAAPPAAASPMAATPVAAPQAAPATPLRQPAGPAPMAASLEDAPDEAPRGGGAGFMAGFAAVTVIALAAAAVYARHEDIAAAAPQLSGALERYVAAVDAARAAVASAVARVTGRG